MSQAKLSSEQFQRITRAISDPNRYEMLRHIFRCGESTCGIVAGTVPITAGTASHHLRELELAELVTVTKDGRFSPSHSTSRDVAGVSGGASGVVSCGYEESFRCSHCGGPDRPGLRLQRV